MKRSTNTSNIISLAIALITILFTLPGRADSEEKAQNKPEKSIVTEISVGLPVLYFRNMSAQGASTSLSIFGYFVDVGFCPTSRFCGTLASHSHVDIRSGRRVFEGPDVGIRYFVLGKTDETKRGSGFFVAEQQSNLRSYVGLSLSQRDFDFRTVVEDRTDIFVGTRPALEGAFWSVAAQVGVDLFLFKDYRVGVGCQYHQSISASVTNFKTSQLLFDLRLLNLTL